METLILFSLDVDADFRIYNALQILSCQVERSTILIREYIIPLTHNVLDNYDHFSSFLSLQIISDSY